MAPSKATADRGSGAGKLGVVTKGNGAELGRFMNDESSRWRRIIENQIKLENKPTARRIRNVRSDRNWRPT
jgi:hypothetical protein